jgi:hypothetical protein
MRKKELCKRFKSIEESLDSLTMKEDKCSDLYRESEIRFKNLCLKKMYKILGYIPDVLISEEQLLKELNMPNDYDNLINFVKAKEKKNSFQS